jgi:tetratricopeptide (TPR) repeat protein
MSTGQQPGSGRGDESNRSHMSGRSEHLVQARDVLGGVHFHAAGGSSGAMPRQLPADVRDFVNRSSDLKQLDRIAFAESAEPPTLVLIAGTAGVGKTSLAVRWAHRVRERFPGGQLYINLRGYDPGAPVEPASALERFLIALHIPLTDIPVDLDARSALFRSIVADKQMLIVLDNAAKANQVRPLLPGEGSSLVVVTSRARLSGLIARDGARCVTVDVFREEESLMLLRRTTEPYRSLDEESEIRELARLCANLPLALRIAAERAAARPRMPLATLINQLRADDLWDALSSDDDEDSDAIRAVFAWSYRALTVDVARMFRLLGQHPGPDFSSGAAAALAGTGRDTARKLLDSLARAHLIEQRGEDRYQFHDLLRAYATDQLRQEESAESRAEALRRELLWYVWTGLNASAAAQSIIEPVVGRVPMSTVEPESFASQSEAVGWYDRERANLLGLSHAAAKAGFEDLAWQLPSAVYPAAFVLRTSFDDVLDMGAVALDAARRAGARRAEAAILGNLGVSCQMANRNDEAERHSLASIEVAREIGDRFALMRGLNSLSWSYLSRRRLEEAIEHFTATRDAAENLPDQAAKWSAIAQINLAVTYVALGRLEEAAELAESTLQMYTDTGDPRLRFDALRWLAHIRTDLGQWDEAGRLLGRADGVVGQIGSQAYEGIVALERGRLALAQGRYDDGLVEFHLSAGIANTVRDRGLEGQAYEGTGTAYIRLNRLDDAVDFLQIAATLFRQGRDAWQQALALEQLATALEARGDSQSAREQRQEGLTAIAPFGDPQALALRRRLEAALGPVD